MDIGVHQGAQGGIDGPVARKWQLAFEGGADNVHIEMAAAIARALEDTGAPT